MSDEINIENIRSGANYIKFCGTTPLPNPFQVSWKFYAVLAFCLALSSIRVPFLGTVLICSICFFFGYGLGIFKWSYKNVDDYVKKYDEISREYAYPCGIERFILNRHRFLDKSSYEQIHSMAQSNLLDPILEQILNHVMIDFVESWYANITNDQLFIESLKRTIRRTVAAFSQCVRKVDFVPLLTQHFVDDVASHLRLYRKAKERFQAFDSSNHAEELETFFFDLELEMEKYCRDLVSTSSEYENAYLHDITDILLYLLMPCEDFRSRPLRFLIREIIVHRLLLPLLDMFSDPDYINRMIVWLLSEISLKPEDFVSTLESSTSLEELKAVLETLNDELALLRAKDAGGEQGVYVKQQIASVNYVIGVIKQKMILLAKPPDETVKKSVAVPDVENNLVVELPIHVVLTNNIAILYFTDFLHSVGGQALLDCYLAIEGFKASVEHEQRALAMGEALDESVYKTVKEAAVFLYQQYFSEETLTRIPLRDAVLSEFLSHIRNDTPPDIWFEEIQQKIVEILNEDERFYQAFKRCGEYEKMLNDLGVVSDDDEEETDAQSVNVSDYNSDNIFASESSSDSEKVKLLVDRVTRSSMLVTIQTLGLGQQGRQTFALYNVRVSRVDENGRVTSSWNVIRRYSDFHTLNFVLQSRFPRLSNICFPGKKTFNNLDSHFLEQRTKALNSYMLSILKHSDFESDPELEEIILNFLTQKDYSGEREGFSKKVMNAMFDPIKNSMRAFGNAVTAVPESVYDGVSKVGDGINKAAKQIIGVQTKQSNGNQPNEGSSRVAAAYTDQQWMESIPLRVLVLLIDEVFGVRGRNAWFRRRLVALLRQFVHVSMGYSINRKIIDLVQWLTSEQQVAQYLIAFKNAVWPDGQLFSRAQRRSVSQQLQTKVLAQAMILSVLPDELRLFIGAETTNAGVKIITEVVQNRHLNRRLLYVILERLLLAIFPENRFDKILPQLHSKSPRSRCI